MDRNTQYVFLGSVLLCSFLSVVYSVSALTITQSETVSIGALVGTLPSVDQGGGGGGSSSQSGVRFSGTAYPYAVVTAQKGTEQLRTVTADETGEFSMVVPERGGQLFTLFATDSAGRRSSLLNFPTVLYNGYLTDIDGIRFAPTIGTDKLAITQGGYLTITGYAAPGIPIRIIINGPEQKKLQPVVGPGGQYSITIPISLMFGEYTIKVGYTDDTQVSKAIRLVVGTTTIDQQEASANIPGDYNLDQKVTMLDFSVLAYWFGRKNPPQTVDINKDGIIDLVDFSILAFYWNG